MLRRAASLHNTVIKPANSRSFNTLSDRVGQMRVATAVDVAVNRSHLLCAVVPFFERDQAIKRAETARASALRITICQFSIWRLCKVTVLYILRLYKDHVIIPIKYACNRPMRVIVRHIKIKRTQPNVGCLWTLFPTFVDLFTYMVQMDLFS